MKTKLLYLASFLLVLFTACSVEETTGDLSDHEKKIKLKSLVKSFAEDVMFHPSYEKFVEELQSKPFNNLSKEELNQEEEEFLNKQSQEFVELYYLVIEMNLAEDEIRQVIVEYLSEKNKINLIETKNDTEGCIVASEGGSLLTIFIALFCQESNTEANEDN